MIFAVRENIVYKLARTFCLLLIKKILIYNLQMVPEIIRFLSILRSSHYSEY